jgi:hypothetical protein
MGQECYLTSGRLHIFCSNGSAVKRVEFVVKGHSVGYHWYRSLVWYLIRNLHVQTEDKSGDTEDSFPEYHLKIIVSDFNPNVGREDIRYFQTEVWERELVWH